MSTDKASEKPKQRGSTLDKLDKLFKLSNSMYAALAALAAVIVANQTEWRRTRFTIYVVSQMWIECVFVVLIWCLYLFIRRLMNRAKRQGLNYTAKDWFRPRTLILSTLILMLAAMFVPPIAYIAKVRYDFWTARVLRGYVEAAKYKIDQQAASGRLDSANNTVEIVSETTKSTPDEHRLDSRKRILEAAIQRSSELGKEAMDQWNYVTQRSKFFHLVESVRLNPENSDAADRLVQKLAIVDGYLGQDANAICSSNGKLADASRKSVALIEARALWDKYGSTDHCVESVRNDLLDGWGVSSIKCILERNSAIRHGGRAIGGNLKSCPDGLNFWTPLPSSIAEDNNEAEEINISHPFYPTFVDIWRKWKQHRDSQRPGA